MLNRGIVPGKRQVAPWLLALGLWGAMAGCGNALAQSNPSRVWTSRDGQEQIRASLVEFDAKRRMVRLQPDNGPLIELPLGQFSYRDQRLVRDPAGATAAPETRSPAKSASARESGRQAKSGQGARQLFGIQWQPNLDSAMQVASGDATLADDRPIMCFRVLGDLAGLM